MVSRGNHTVVRFVVVAEKAKMLDVELCGNQLLSTILKKNQKDMDSILPPHSMFPAVCCD